ncbi:MAG TPA: hypothetical protein VK524_19930, partial [Polyangiaceae bacterium]|nr:hypothetical protein [Polyangiaceae bacterium]
NGEELARRCDRTLSSSSGRSAQLPKTEAFASSPTWVARPSPALDRTVDLAPLAPSPSEPRVTRPESVARQTPEQPVLPQRPSTAPRAAFPWLTLVGVLLGLGIAGGAAYYALFVNMPEGGPPPPPSSVGSPLPEPTGIGDAAADASSQQPRDVLPADCPQDASLCECCPSGFTCQGPCDDFVTTNERWLVRLAALEGEEGDAGPLGAATEVCMRVANRREAEVCNTLASVADARVPPAALEVLGLDLVQTGVEIAVHQKWISEVPIARTTLRVAINRKQLCQGVELTELDEPGPVKRLVLYLDPPDQDAGTRCATTTNPPP